MKEKDTNFVLKVDKERVISWFEDAMENLSHQVHINLYYSPHCKAWAQLQKEGILKSKFLGKLYIGTEYKGGLFTQESGSGDCEELLYYHGQIETE